MRGSVLEARITRGSVQTRQVPCGPVMVPESVSPCGSEIVGHPAAGVTSTGPVGVGVGVGAGAGGLLIVMLPPVPGEAMSSGPQAASASTLQPSTSERVRSVTANGPLKNRESDGAKSLIAIPQLGP